MKVQSLLALLPFLSLALADADQAWKDVCEASPPKDKVTINGVEFKYTCDRSCDRNSIVEITGTFDHPDKCAEQITSSPEELITWRKDAQKCWKCTAPTTAPNSYMILVMQKEDDPFGPPTPPPSTAQQLADWWRGRGGGGGSPVTNTTPQCGKAHTQGSYNWDVTCGKLIGGAKQDRLTLTTFEACIDECNARQNSGQGCDRVAYLGNQVVNQCLLSTGAPKEVRK